MYISEFQHTVSCFVPDKGAGLPKSGGSRGGCPFTYGRTMTLLDVWALTAAVSGVLAGPFYAVTVLRLTGRNIYSIWTCALRVAITLLYAHPVM